MLQRTKKKREKEIKRQSYPERKKKYKIINDKISEKNILSKKENNSVSSKKKYLKKIVQ